MIRPLTIESKIHFERRGRGGCKQVHAGSETVATQQGRVPRIARLMALAIRFEELIRSGEVADYAELAKLAHVTRARITQIMNLLLLAPDIQETILFLSRAQAGRDTIHLRQLQSIALVSDWVKQRRSWRQFVEMQT